MRLTALALAAALAAAAGTAAHGPALSQTTTTGSLPPVPFTEPYLADEANVAAGRAIWEEQCRHCHGKSAYPGKAPKLRPARYQPDFVYRRITDGFRKMPPWKDVYTDEERMQITTYILSPHFSP